MFIYHRLIHVQDTDATGVLYFANELQIALEAFEEFLLTQGFSIGEMVRKNEIFTSHCAYRGRFFVSPDDWRSSRGSDAVFKDWNHLLYTYF